MRVSGSSYRVTEALPLLTADPPPPNHAHLYGVKSTQHVDSQTSDGLSTSIQKWIVLQNLVGGLKQRVSPLMSSLARTKPKVRPDTRDQLIAQNLLPPLVRSEL